MILAFFTFSDLLHAQQVAPVLPAATNKLKKVREAMNSLDWNEAKNLSGKLVKQFPDWPEAWKVNAEVYQEEGDLVASEKALRRMVQLDSTGYPEAYRWIAQWRFNRGDYPNASVFFSTYLGLIHDTANLPYAEKLLHSSIRFALEQLKNPKVKLPIKLAGPVNTPDDEYFPSLSVDGSVLVFTRQTKDPGNVKKAPQEDLFHVAYQDTGYRMPEAFPFPINTRGNEGTQSLSQDGRIMFFTACNRPDTKGGCDIYYSVKSGDNWSDPVNLGYPVNSRYWESTPFLAPDGKRLFFASNRPGGSGGMDIWQSTLKPDRSWSAPVNLGQPVNTPFDELSPAILVDGNTLFFSSNGHIGMGGFDLYRFDLSNKNKSYIPDNLGYMLNTCYDEDGLTVNTGLNLGLFASNRDTLTGKDIYQADMNPFIPAGTTLTLSGTVKDRITGLPVSAKVEVQPHGDTLISSVEADPVTGIYLLGIPERPAYRIGASCYGYLPYSFYYMNDTLTKIGKIQHSIDLEPIQTGAAIVLRNIFFAFNSFELLTESDKDLEEILTIFRQNPGIVIEISGYTDNTGAVDYNLILSQNRAESVVKYLINHGISPDQLRAKGYGLTNPVAANETEEGRSLNRRTEMKVIRMK
ncbi:MAG: OmpA family protein [Bacteroidia bacterium]|nr:OmpA family protein [Bacteroidia bacterium]